MELPQEVKEFYDSLELQESKIQARRPAGVSQDEIRKAMVACYERRDELEPVDLVRTIFQIVGGPRSTLFDLNPLIDRIDDQDRRIGKGMVMLAEEIEKAIVTTRINVWLAVGFLFWLVIFLETLRWGYS